MYKGHAVAQPGQARPPANPTYLVANTLLESGQLQQGGAITMMPARKESGPIDEKLDGL